MHVYRPYSTDPSGNASRCHIRDKLMLLFFLFREKQILSFYLVQADLLTSVFEYNISQVAALSLYDVLCLSLPKDTALPDGFGVYGQPFMYLTVYWSRKIFNFNVIRVL